YCTADRPLARYDMLDGLVSTAGQVFLGMTFNCARCHDHKKDPIPQTDYYRLASFFEDVRRYDNSRDPRSMTTLTDITPAEQRKLYEDELKQREIRRAEIDREMVRL